MDSSWISVLVSALVTGGIAFLMSRTKPRTSRDGKLIVRMHPALLIFLLIVSLAGGLAMFVGGLTMLPSEPLTALFVTIVGLLFLLSSPFSVIALMTDAYDVILDESGVTGPGSVYTFNPGKSRHTIPWSDMQEMGQTQLQSRYVENTSGQRVYWGEYHSGHAELEAHIEAHLTSDDFFD